VLTRLAVEEEEELVSEHLHLQRSFLSGHRLHLEPLGPDDPIATVWFYIGSFRRLVKTFVPATVALDQTLLEPAELPFVSVGCRIERSTLIGRLGLDSDDVPSGSRRDLDSEPRIGLTGILSVGELDIDVPAVVEDPPRMFDTLLGDDPCLIRNLHVPAVNLNCHQFSSRVGTVWGRAERATPDGWDTERSRGSATATCARAVWR
jgi:hypothetical protein